MINSFKQTSPSQDSPNRSALLTSLGTGILFTIVTAIIAPFAFKEDAANGLAIIAPGGAVALAAFIAAFQVSRNRVTLGIGILVSTILLAALGLPFVTQGEGLALGIMILLMVASISSNSLSPVWATRAIVSAFFIIVLSTVVDIYFPDFGIATAPLFTNLIAVVISLPYAIHIIRSLNTFSLRTKIIIAFVVVTIIPLVALSAYNSTASTRALEAENRTHLSALAGQASNSIDSFITDQTNTIFIDAKQLSLTQFVLLPPSARAGSLEEANARITLAALTRKHPVFIRSIGILNVSGNNILDTKTAYEGQDESNFIYFFRPLHTSLPFASNILFHNDQPSIYFSSAIIDAGTGATIGILRVEFDASIFQSIILDIDPGNIETTISLIDTGAYLKVATTAGHNEIFTSIKDFTNLDFAALQAENRLPARSRESILVNLDDSLIAGLDNLAQQPFFNGYSQSLASDTINTGKFLTTQPWIALVQQSTRVYLAPIKQQNNTTILIALALIVLSVVSGYYASQILTSPLVSLSRVAEKITAGDRTALAVASNADEIGALATSFNRMTEELNQTFINLEQRVAERTTDLEIARQLSEKRAQELQSIGEISRLITGEQKLEILLPLICRLVSERFGYYHTGIFLLDDTGQFAVLQAANSSGGGVMLARGHRLLVGEGGIVGYVAKFGVPRIALDVGQDADFFNNPDLPNTRSEMALPLKGHDRIAGVLDVQDEKPGAFTENDANTLSILTDQIAISLENAKLFAQNQQALSEAQALYRQNSQESWLTFSREEASVGYQQSIKGGKKLTTPIETEEIREAMNRGNIMVLQQEANSKEASIVVPLKLRGQVIGVLNIKAPSADRHWSTDEVNLAEAVSERLSLALENARLIQESQRQVIKEQTISDVTSKIGASINLRNVLQTAVEELGRAIPGSDVLIQFNSDTTQRDS